MMKSKILSVILACLMVLSVMPVGVFAEEHNHEAEVVTCPGADQPHTMATAIDPVKVEGEYILPTCTEIGGQVYRCSACSTAFISDFVPATGHTYVTAEGKAPTCTDTGLTEGLICEVCGDAKEPQEVIDALGHTVVVDNAVAPTCTETGLTEGSHCSVCEVILVAQTEVPALGHTWVFDSITAPGEGELSEVTYVCHCGEVKTAKVACTNHNQDGVIPAVPSTCTETGLTEGKYCTICGETVVDPTDVAVLPHTEVVDDAVAPTCTETGLTEGKHCSVCGTVTVAQETVDALGHTEEIIPGYEGTCDYVGKTEGKKCSVCDEILVAQQDTTWGHVFVVVYVAPATCTESGYTTYKCEKLGCDVQNHNVDSDPIGHDWEEVARKAPTCTEKGSITYECKNGCKTQHIETTPATGHTPVVNEVAGTCVAKSYKYDTCENCDYVGEPYDLGAIDSDNHDFTKVERVNDPTCYEEGQDLVKCEDCGKIEIQAVAVVPHTWDAGVVTLEPTCGTIGAKLYTCTVVDCEATKTEEYTYYIPHTEVIDVAVDPTCTATGLTEGKHCSACETVIVAQVPVDALGHTETAVVTDPTCTTGGYTTYTCSVCGNVEDRDQVGELGHTEITGDDERYIAPKCNTAGQTEGKHCSVCGVVTLAVEVIPALGEAEDYGEHFFNFNSFEDVDKAGHSIDLANPIKFVAKTCTVDGYHIYKCNNCEKQVVVFEKAEHLNVVEVPAVPATCTATGLTAGLHCEACGVDVLAQVPVDALGHTETAAVTAPTCTEEGYTTYTCSVCGNIEKRDQTDALGHTDVTDNAVAPTCTEAGLTEGKHCSVCGLVFVAQEPVDALGHEYKIIEGYAADCLNTGMTDGAYCPVCNYVHIAQTVIPAKGHDYDVDVIAPTCTVAGFTYAICTVCDKEIHYDYVPELGHTVVTDAAVDPTCIATGLTEGSHCSTCGEVFVAQDEIPMVPHSNAAGEALVNSCTNVVEHGRFCDKGCGQTFDAAHATLVTVYHAPTCVEEGYEVTYCPACEEIFNKVAKDKATGHAFDLTAEPDESIPATCLTDGTNKYLCLNCGVEEEVVTVPALGHAWNAEYVYTEFAHWHTCGRCDATTDPADHDFTSSKPVVVEPTLSTDGSKTWTCVCGQTKVEILTLGQAVGFEFDIKNDLDVAGATFANSSLVAVTINMKGYNGAVANGMTFKVNYDNNAVVFEGYEFVNTNFDGDRYAWMGINGVVDHGSYLNVVANLGVENYNVDAPISADGEALVVLYFRVNTKTLNSATFSFSDMQVNVADTNADLVKVYDKASTITFNKFLDANNDGKVNMTDFNIAAGLVDEGGYKIQVDVNKDGVIDIENDLLAIYKFFVYENEDELLAMRP